MRSRGSRLMVSRRPCQGILCGQSEVRGLGTVPPIKSAIYPLPLQSFFPPFPPYRALRELWQSGKLRVYLLS